MQVLRKFTLIERCVIFDGKSWCYFEKPGDLIVEKLNLSKLSELCIFIDSLTNFVIVSVYFEVHPVVKSLFDKFDHSEVMKFGFVVVVSANPWPV